MQRKEQITYLYVIVNNEVNNMAFIDKRVLRCNSEQYISVKIEPKNSYIILRAQKGIDVIMRGKGNVIMIRKKGE